jgi:hypothetical protein
VRGGEIQLLLRPLGPLRIVGGDEIQQDIRIDEDQPSSSPRVRAITSSVVMLGFALPRTRANLLSGARCRVFKKTRPSAANSNSTDDPGLKTEVVAQPFRDRHLTLGGDLYHVRTL